MREKLKLINLIVNHAQYDFLTRFNKIAIQGSPQMAVDNKANSLSRVYSSLSRVYSPNGGCSRFIYYNNVFCTYILITCVYKSTLNIYTDNTIKCKHLFPLWSSQTLHKTYYVNVTTSKTYKLYNILK